MNHFRIVYGVKHKDEDIRSASRSGGIFTALSDVVLDNGGIVYGCALNDDLYAVHRRATTKEERDAFRGSKYIQSDIENCYQLTAEDLKNGLTVLFSGTPCQIHGLLNFLSLKKVNTDSLLTVEILCHGVPSPRVWQDFIDSNFDRKKITAVDFRDKKNFGWRDHVETITVEDEEKSSRDYGRLFLSHLTLRQSCFNCYYKKTDRVSDITIGDYWRIENNDKDFDDDKGVSFVKINNQKGQEYFDKCRDNLIVREYPLASSIQPVLDHNFNQPGKRDAFWQEYTGDNLMELIEKYTAQPKPSIVKKVLGRAKPIVKTMGSAFLRVLEVLHII